MSGGTILLWLVGLFYAAMFAMFLIRWIEQGIASINRRRRSSQPRVICKVRTGG